MTVPRLPSSKREPELLERMDKTLADFDAYRARHGETVARLVGSTPMSERKAA